jgi:hypothetical protein
MDSDAALQSVMAWALREAVSRMAQEMVVRHEAATLKDVLGREPTWLELLCYENELWRWGLDQWWRDRQQGYWKIHDFVWGK